MDQQEFQFDATSRPRRKATSPRHRARHLLAALCLVVALVALGLVAQRHRREHKQDEVIRAAAVRYDMPEALIRAVVWRESRFDPDAHGSVGEVGLMQISKLAAQEWAEAEQIDPFEHHQLFDPAQNTLAGTWYLKKLIRRYAHTDHPLTYALADYNAGRSNVLRWLKGSASTHSADFLQQIDFPSTKRYILSVLRRYKHYADGDPRPGDG